MVVGDGEKLTAESAGGVAVVYGGSNGAAQAALGCATKADHVYLISRSPIEKSMSSYVIGTVRNQPKITVITGEISKIDRDAKGNLFDCQTKDGKTIPCKAVGVFIGSVPETNWLEGRVARNDKGLIQTDADFRNRRSGRLMPWAISELAEPGASAKRLARDSTLCGKHMPIWTA